MLHKSMGSNVTHCLGFVFSESLEYVLLLNKNNGPVTARGWNGFGGKVKEGESWAVAMWREMKEESALDIEPSHWHRAGYLYHGGSGILVATSWCHDLGDARDSGDGPIGAFRVSELLQQTTALYVPQMVVECHRLANQAQHAYTPFVFGEI